MNASLTFEQILSLAADKYAIRTARTWSTREKWLHMGQDHDPAWGHIVWGEFKGKSKTPIQTMVSLARPLFSCTCSGRKLPCSHALGLRLLFGEAPHLFLSSPPHASDTARSRTAAKTASKTATEAATWNISFTDEGTLASYINDPHASESRLLDSSPHQEQLDVARLEQIRKGLDELDLWLGDVVRNGLESVRNKNRAVDWQRMARRLVDAQASELANSVRKLANLPDSTPSWPEELIARMGALHLLVEGFRRFEDLPTGAQGDLRLAVGWLPKVEPNSETTLVDRWHVVARYQEQHGKQRRQKIWLWGEESNCPALVVHILTNKQKQVESLAPGVVFAGSLYFYPSMAPLRAEFVSIQGAESQHRDNAKLVSESSESAPLSVKQPENPVAGFATLDAAFDWVNQAFTQNPWMTEFPILVRSARVEQISSRNPNIYDAPVDSLGNLFSTATSPKPAQWILTDSSGFRLPLPDKFEYGWHLQAMGNPLDSPAQAARDAESTHEDDVCPPLFGTWDRSTFTPFTVWQGGRWLSLHILRGESS